MVIDPTVTHNADANFTGQMNRVADNDSTSSTQLESAYPEATKDPHTVLLLHFNEANGTTAGIRDYASTTRVITANGNASTTSYVTQLGLGNSAAFDGTGDYLSVPDSDDFNFGSGDFSISTWANFGSLSAANAAIVAQWGSNDRGFVLVKLSDNATLNFAYSTDGAASIDVPFTWSPSANTWHYITLVRNGADLKAFVDGRHLGTYNISTATIYNSTRTLDVGADSGSPGSFTTGFYDELRIVKGTALTPDQIKASASRRPYSVYTSSVLDASASVQWDTVNWTEGGVATGNGEQPYNTNSLVAQWDFNDTSGTTLTASSSGSCTTACNGTLTNFAYTASQDQATTTTGWTNNNKRWGTGALMFDGVNDYVSVADNISLKPANISVSAWFKRSSAGTYDGIITKWNHTTNNREYMLDIGSVATNKITWLVSSNGLASNSITSATTVSDGVWYYVVGVYDGSALKLYVNGKEESFVAYNSGIYSGNSQLRIGHSYDDVNNYYFSGIIDSTRIYSRALSASEILSNYNAGNIQLQTRTGATSDPNDGTWEAWKPITGETQLLSMDSDAANWRSDIMASTTIATSTETVIKTEGTGSLKVKMGMASTTAGATALWHFEETGTTTGTYLYDETANNNDATTTGTTVVDGIFGKARKINGTSDYLSIADSSSFDVGLSNEPFTIEAFVKTADTNGNIISRGGGTSAWNSTNGQQYHLTSFTNNIQFYWWTGSTWEYVFSNEAIATEGWTHVVVTYDGTTTKIFINGIAQTRTATAVYAKPSSSNITKIGLIVSNESPLNGTLDSLRILKGRALSADEIAESYRMGANHHLTRQVSAVDLSSANKLAFNVAGDRPGTYLEAMLGESDYANYELASSTLALSTTTVLYIKGDEIASSTSIKDSSFSGKAITANGNARTAGNGKIGNSVYFDGTGDYLSVADSDDWTWGTNYSIDLWVNPTNFTGGADQGIELVNHAMENANDFWRIYIGKDGGCCARKVVLDIYQGTPLAGITSGITLVASQWYHIAIVKMSSNYYMYINSQLVGSVTTATVMNNNSGTLRIGDDINGTGSLNGSLDELRIIKGTALTPDQIRQAYEYGLRTHPITIDFGATLQTSDLISSATDYKFSLTATTSGLSATTSGLYLGDKIIIKENLGGTEYTAQGTVNAINTTTGAITVPSWDTGSTFPASNGYSPNATVFKWQREYFDITGAATTTRDAITNLTFRPTNGAEGRTIWLDDFRYNTNYLTASSSSAITSGNNRYLQYRAVFSSWDSFVSPYLSAFNTLYTSLANSFPAIIGISGGGFLSF